MSQVNGSWQSERRSYERLVHFLMMIFLGLALCGAWGVHQTRTLSKTNQPVNGAEVAHQSEIRSEVGWAILHQLPW